MRHGCHAKPMLSTVKKSWGWKLWACVIAVEREETESKLNAGEKGYKPAYQLLEY